MKPLKYTVAALAILAAASFSTSAHAASAGDLILGVYDSTNTVTNSFELDLGAFSSLTDGETFNLGTTVSTEFGSVSASSLLFNIAATSQGTGAGGLGASPTKEIALTVNTNPASLGSLTTPNTDLSAVISNFGAGTAISLPSTTSSNGTAISAISLANATNGSFAFEYKTTAYGLVSGSTNVADIAGTLATTTPVNFYTYSGGSVAGLVSDGTFSLSNVDGNEILTYNLAATPEPSAYALGLCAVALFFVLRRRSTVA